MVGVGTAEGAVVAGISVDGPDPAIVGGGNIAMARDGTAAVVYLKNVAGVAHVFASRLAAGGWSVPVQLDAGLAGAGASPLIAAGNGGRLVAAFINGGTLYASVLPAAAAAAFTPPQPIAGGASFPALAASVNGVAYVSWTAAQGGIDKVWAARLDRTATSFGGYGQPLNLNASANAADTAAARSRVTIATDGIGLVTWAEQNGDGHTHVIARKVYDGGISTEPQDLTLPSLQGMAGGPADEPQASLEDIADYGWVVFRQTFYDNGAPISRTIARHLIGSLYDVPESIDPLGFPTADAADEPQIQIGGTGDGLAAAELSGSRQVYADILQDPDFKGLVRVDAGTDGVAPAPVLALGETGDGGIAWEESSGPGEPVSIAARPYIAGGLMTAASISPPGFGAVDPSAGLTAAADQLGDALFAFVQDSPAGRRLVVGGSALPPADFTLALGSGINRSARPVIRWTPALDPLGLSAYQVYVDGHQIGTTTATRFVPAAKLSDGVHRVTIIAVDRFGQSNQSDTQQLRIVVRPPRATLTISGTRRAGSALTFNIRARDRVAGIASVHIDFGDGHAVAATRASHAYARAGSYTVRVLVVNRAGGRALLRTRLFIR